MTSDELRARIELIKKRQKAATSSIGTRALLIQTFSEDLPWLIEQAERLADAEAALAECEREKAELQGKVTKYEHGAWAENKRFREQVIPDLERKLAAAREAALTLMRSCQCEGTGGVPFPDSLGGGQVACPGHEQSLCLAREGSKILAALTEAGE